MRSLPRGTATTSRQSSGTPRRWSARWVAPACATRLGRWSRPATSRQRSKSGAAIRRGPRGRCGRLRRRPCRVPRGGGGNRSSRATQVTSRRRAAGSAAGAAAPTDAARRAVGSVRGDAGGCARRCPSRGQALASGAADAPEDERRPRPAEGLSSCSRGARSGPRSSTTTRPFGWRVLAQWPRMTVLRSRGAARSLASSKAQPGAGLPAKFLACEHCPGNRERHF